MVEKMAQKTKKEINVLLLGETGVGKSTFINSFINYVENESLEKALKNNYLSILIPVKFTLIDNNDKLHVIKQGEDGNEDKNIGHSSTQMARCYKFILADGGVLRFIDTPGIGDSRGVEQDRENFEYILQHLSGYKEIHAICFLLKPNVTVLTPFFKFCILELLTHLEKSAADNIVFVFTNARGTNYKPGDSIALIRQILGEIQENNGIKIKCEIKGPKKNVFCLDNEGFRYVLAKKRNINYGQLNLMKNSWSNATVECWSLINYIGGTKNEQGLKALNIRGTISINQARNLIASLAKPLADIADNIKDNLLSLSRQQDHLSSERASLQELKKALFVPVTNIVKTKLHQPVTVCTSNKCSEIYSVFGISKYHYKQRCHNPCPLTGVPKEVIGSPELLKCQAMGGSTRCQKCGCDFSTHMHIYYETKVTEGKEEDQSVISKISTSEEIIHAINNVITQLLVKYSELDHEKRVISDYMAKLACFLQKNSICPVNDAYEAYLDYVIEREQNLGSQAQNELLKRYKQMKREHLQLMSIFKDSNLYEPCSFNAENVFDSVKTLYALKHTGKIIKELHGKQEKLLKNEHGHFAEYLHNKAIPTQPEKPTNENYDSVKGKLFYLIKSNNFVKARNELQTFITKYNLENNVEKSVANERKLPKFRTWRRSWASTNNIPSLSQKQDKADEAKERTVRDQST